jgi:hypothetical protein
VHAPRTREGRAVAALLGRPGLWHRSGLDGSLSGLDWPGALAALPAGLDRDRCKRLLAAAEGAFVSAWLDAADAAEKTNGQRRSQIQR